MTLSYFKGVSPSFVQNVVQKSRNFQCNIHLLYASGFLSTEYLTFPMTFSDSGFVFPKERIPHSIGHTSLDPFPRAFTRIVPPVPSLHSW